MVKLKKTPRDKHVCYVNPTTKITSDGLQWIINFKSGEGWSPRWFIASTKTILFRCLHEAGRVPDKRGAATLARLPDTFREWSLKKKKKG